MILEAAIGVCIHEWSKSKQRRCQTISDWFFDMSNWPSGGFVWFSQHLQNPLEATKIQASNVHEIRKYFEN